MIIKKKYTTWLLQEQNNIDVSQINSSSIPLLVIVR